MPSIISGTESATTALFVLTDDDEVMIIMNSVAVPVVNKYPVRVSPNLSQNSKQTIHTAVLHCCAATAAVEHILVHTWYRSSSTMYLLIEITNIPTWHLRVHTISPPPPSKVHGGENTRIKNTSISDTIAHTHSLLLLVLLLMT